MTKQHVWFMVQWICTIVSVIIAINYMTYIDRSNPFVYLFGIIFLYFSTSRMEIRRGFMVAHLFDSIIAVISFMGIVYLGMTELMVIIPIFSLVSNLLRFMWSKPIVTK